ncbi:hypothetical protein FOL47_002238 [Perkinsus chesapeaki]|uniref:Uncharacterized protein n=1 Tax=Perkinsus chesapeaki TaxID=330153 RepID=A0A7J6N1L9_PERCH|nr:hypothetical protein FOL47_002238 [Perkinsus chesapeaki]
MADKHHEYLSGQGTGEVYAMAKPMDKAANIAPSNQRAAADAHLANVALTGAAAVVETSDGLFAPDELTNDSNEPEANTATENNKETMQEEDDPLLSIIKDKSILLEVGVSVELGKSKAIKLFQESKHLQSAEMLTRCINSSIEAESGNTTLRSVLHSNRALAILTYINGKGGNCQELYRLVVEDCDQALHFDHGNMKALYRRAIAFYELDEIERSLEDISRVLTVFSARNEAHPEAVDLKEKVMEKKRAAEKKWGMNGPMSISRLWNKPSGRAPADEDRARPASIETNELVKMHVAIPNMTGADGETEASSKPTQRNRPTAKHKSGTFTPSILESELQRLKGKADGLAEFVAHKLTPKKLEDAGTTAGGLSSLDPDCTGALLHGLYEAIQRKAIDNSVLMDYVEAMDKTQMANRMVLLMLDETEKGYLSKLNSHIMANTTKTHAPKARYIVNEWHKRG